MIFNSKELKEWDKYSINEKGYLINNKLIHINKAIQSCKRLVGDTEELFGNGSMCYLIMISIQKYLFEQQNYILNRKKEVKEYCEKKGIKLNHKFF